MSEARKCSNGAMQLPRTHMFVVPLAIRYSILEVPIGRSKVDCLELNKIQTLLVPFE